MQISEFLNGVCEQIKYEPIRKEISEEMKNHLIEAKENYMSEGMPEKQAEETATQQMGNAEEIGKQLNKIHRPKLDWKLLLIAFVLVVFGGLVTFTREMNCWNYIDNKGVFSYTTSMYQYIITVLVGGIISMFFYFFDYRKIVKCSKYLYAMATLLLIFTANFGFPINGASTYISIYIFNIYTPMLAVPLYMLAFIGWIQNINNRRNLKINFVGKREICISWDVLKIIFLGGISLILLAIMPATASMFILAIVYLMVATVKLANGKKNRGFYVTILWGIPIILGILYIIFRMPMVWNRLVTSVVPEQDPMGGGWIGMNQNMILESANLFGQADNMSNALTIFDEGTNFALISILAHYGWVISIAMVITIVAFSIKLMINAVKIKDMYGKLLMVGMAGLFILQSIFNLLMNFNLGIKSNVNLPFISYGRQDLVVNMICLALVLSVYRRKDILVQYHSSCKIEEVNHTNVR